MMMSAPEQDKLSAACLEANFPPVGFSFASRSTATKYCEILNNLRGPVQQKITQKAGANTQSSGNDYKVEYNCAGKECVGGIVCASKQGNGLPLTIVARASCVCPVNRNADDIKFPDTVFDTVDNAKAAIVRHLVLKLKIPVLEIRSTEPPGWQGLVYWRGDDGTAKKRKRGRNCSLLFFQLVNERWLGVAVTRRKECYFHIENFPKTTDVVSSAYECTASIQESTATGTKKTVAVAKQVLFEEVAAKYSPEKTKHAFECSLSCGQMATIHLCCTCSADVGFCLSCFHRLYLLRGGIAGFDDENYVEMSVVNQNRTLKCPCCRTETVTKYSQMDNKDEEFLVHFPVGWLWARPFFQRAEMIKHQASFERIIRPLHTKRLVLLFEVQSLECHIVEASEELEKLVDGSLQFSEMEIAILNYKERQHAAKAKLSSIKIPEWATDVTSCSDIPAPQPQDARAQRPAMRYREDPDEDESVQSNNDYDSDYTPNAIEIPSDSEQDDMIEIQSNAE
jgi:hypothetical protein